MVGCLAGGSYQKTGGWQHYLHLRELSDRWGRRQLGCGSRQMTGGRDCNWGSAMPENGTVAAQLATNYCAVICDRLLVVNADQWVVNGGFEANDNRGLRNDHAAMSDHEAMIDHEAKNDHEENSDYEEKCGHEAS